MKERIVDLPCKKHIKIYKLKELGLSNKEIADALGTNAGHVYNALKAYKDNPSKIEQANAIEIN
jgi:transcriptional regulator